MKLGLCMVVKNEEAAIRKSLGAIYDLFDSVAVIDTGSTDRTVNILRDEYKITPIIWVPNPHATDAEDRQWEPKARNLSLQVCQTPWVLTLDADEIVSREDILKIKALEPEADGYFLRWQNERDGQVYDDYKLCLFRNDKGVRYDGYMHTNPQLSFQKLGLKAQWLENVSILHDRDGTRPGRSDRADRLRSYVEAFPENQRYKWFLGYTLYKEGRQEEARSCFESVSRSQSSVYPAECLNAHVVLTEIYNNAARPDKSLETVNNALQFFKAHAGHFEVKVNGRIKHWLEDTKSMLERRESAAPSVKALEFPF